MKELILERTVVSSCFEVFGVSIPGSKRKKTHDESQDYFACQTEANWIVAIVSDGAGSARRGKDGAVLISESLCEALACRLAMNDGKPISDWIAALLEDCISVVRKRCSDLGDLTDFHATLVGLVARESEASLFHIGDGAISAHRIVDNQIVTTGFSLPENGEYSNQTYFFTLASWKNHLRVQNLNSTSTTFWLMTDGMHILATDKPFEPALRESTVVEFDILFKKHQEIGKTELLRSILTSPPAQRQSDGDDMTLVVVSRRDQQDGYSRGL